ncbi:hypothetical protein PAN31117_05282 [Pandoraea anapnoica]|uniref:Lipoprotein n=1 Tax=Pandoraea anapnoica TaxID=2508301 RepID=A0A5E5AQ86_9BURK|nr:hypothetical protein PIN31009_05452 [Pandoraea iniqua]VVE75909.1 hypothetical protein PAN31117_05282 [Pandoraea anapnoica]
MRKLLMLPAAMAVTVALTACAVGANREAPALDRGINAGCASSLYPKGEPPNTPEVGKRVQECLQTAHVQREAFQKHGQKIFPTNPDPSDVAITREGVLYGCEAGEGIMIMRGDRDTEATYNCFMDTARALGVPVHAPQF